MMFGLAWTSEAVASGDVEMLVVLASAAPLTTPSAAAASSHSRPGPEGASSCAVFDSVLMMVTPTGNAGAGVQKWTMLSVKLTALRAPVTRTMMR